MRNTSESSPCSCNNNCILDNTRRNQSAAKKRNKSKKRTQQRGLANTRRKLVASSSLVLLTVSSSQQRVTSAFVPDSTVRHYPMTKSVDSGSSHFTPGLRTSCRVESYESSRRRSQDSSPPARSSMDPLSYRNGDESEESPPIVADVVVNSSAVVPKQRQRQFRWHQSILGSDEPSSSARSSKRMTHEQMLLDKYLESVDRRYRRLHDDDKVGSINWTWDWLMRGDSNHSSNQNNNSPSNRSCNEDDALCVLGLADLASDRLLKQHRLPRNSSTVTVTSVEDPETKHPLFRIMHTIRRRRAKCAAMLALHSRKNHQRVFRTISSRAPSIAATVSSVLLSLAGTKKTLHTCQAAISFITQALTRKQKPANPNATAMSLSTGTLAPASM